jgi:hypothetical protein
VLPLAGKVNIMEQAHWLSRKRASIAMAQKAVSGAARLIHYELAGRYSVKAADAARPQLHLEDAPPPEVYAVRDLQAPSPEERS